MKNKILYLLLAAALMFANISIAQTSPSIHIKPDKALVDEVVSISLSGLAPNQRATLKANMIDNRGTPWQSSAEFIADKNGLVDLARQSPVRGSYNGVDPIDDPTKLIKKIGLSELYLLYELQKPKQLFHFSCQSSLRASSQSPG